MTDATDNQGALRGTPHTIAPAEVREYLTKKVLAAIGVPYGSSLSYPVPALVGGTLGLAWFVYGKPVLPAGSGPRVSRPRWWLLTAHRECRALLFADCAVHSFVPAEDGKKAAWIVDGPPVASLAELITLDRRLLDVLDAFWDLAFAGPDELVADQRAALAEYVELIHRLTPTPLHTYLRDLSPGFWEWAKQNGASA